MKSDTLRHSPDARRRVQQPGEAYIERFWGIECLLPSLRAIGQSRRIVALEQLPAHIESNFEIHLVMDGAVDLWVEGEAFHAPPDSIFVTRPDELHGGVQNMIQPSSLTWLQVDLETLGDREISAELQQLDKRVCPGAHTLIQHATAMLNECRNPRSDSRRIIDGHLRLLLAQLTRQYQASPTQRRYPPALETLLTYIEENISTRITVVNLCEAVGLSRSRVFQLFDTHVGQSPVSYAMSVRIKRAQLLLSQDQLPISDIAGHLGFASSQHFSTVFRRHTGLSPSRYRKQNNSD